jgi:peptidoglycan/xylan/chitin deacetylase (PgdA/CDA1 family)
VAALPRLGVWFVVVVLMPATAQAAALEDEPPPPPQVALTVGRAAFSPNGDGVLDVTGAVVTVDVAVGLTLEVLDATGTVVRTLQPREPIQPGKTRVNWRGLDDERHVVSDGTYTIRAIGTDEAGGTSTAEAPVLVDTLPPSVHSRSISPEPVERVSGGVTIAFRAAGAEHGRLLVADLAGRLVHRDAWDGRGGAIDRRWDLRTDRGDRVPPGLYRVTVTARDAAGNTATSEPRVLRDVHPVTARVVTSVQGAGGRVALTFDDCVYRSAWAQILRTLAAAHAQATFFCTGPRVLAAPALARRTVREGNGVGSHGWDHTDLTTLSLEEIRDRLARDEAVWWRTTGVMAVPFVRPPYGELDEETRRAAGSLGYAWIALWSVDPRDWELPGASAIASRVLSHVQAGSIVVLHVNPQTADALPAILRGLRTRGLRSVTLFELLTQASTVQPGRVARMPV